MIKNCENRLTHLHCQIYIDDKIWIRQLANAWDMDDGEPGKWYTYSFNDLNNKCLTDALLKFINNQ